MKLLVLLAFALFCASAAAGLRDVDFDPRPGAQVPLDLPFHEAGRRVTFDRFFGAAPVVLQLGYLGCINLCSTAGAGVIEALSVAGLAPGRDYTALFVSIDPRDEAAPPERRDGWHLLTGAASAAAVARSVGFRYAFEEESGQFAHPAGFVVLTPAGTVFRYFAGVRFDAGELRAALLAAGRGEPPGAFERLLLVCFHDPVTGRYSKAVLDSLRLLIVAFLALAGWLAWRRR
jgi:protein SCO1/2